MKNYKNISKSNWFQPLTTIDAYKIIKSKNLAWKEILASSLGQKLLLKQKVSQQEIAKNLSYLLLVIRQKKSKQKCFLSNCLAPLNWYWYDFKVINGNIHHHVTICSCLVKKKGKWVSPQAYLSFKPKAKFCNLTLAKVDTFSLTRKKVIAYLKKFIKNYPYYQMKGLLILGANGCGKTHLLMAFAHDLLVKEPNIAYFDCKQSFAEFDLKNWSVKKLIRSKYQKAKVLFVDGLGEEKINIFTRDLILYPILKYRNQHNHFTFISSRYDFSQLLKRYKIKNSFLDAQSFVKVIKNLTLPIIIKKPPFLS